MVTSFDSGKGFAWDGDETGLLFSPIADPNIKTAVAPYSSRFCSLATIVEEIDHELDTISLNPKVLALNDLASDCHLAQPSCNAVHPANTPTIRLPKALLKLLGSAPAFPTGTLLPSDRTTVADTGGYGPHVPQQVYLHILSPHHTSMSSNGQQKLHTRPW